MKSLMGVSDDAAIMPRVLTHYHLTAPLIEASLSGAPIVFRNHPAGLEKDGVFHVTSFPLTANTLLRLVHAKYAIRILHVGADGR